MKYFDNIIVTALTLAALLLGVSALWYVKYLSTSEATVRTFQWEDTTYLVATGPDGSVAITAHFDPLP
jgi:EamA domain-containing membrane protein RarD